MERGPSFAQQAGAFLWHGPSFMSRAGAGVMPHEAPQADTPHLRRVMGVCGLTMMSAAAILGAGIFVLTGKVAHATAGPGVIVSYAIGGIVALICAIAYMEFAAETQTTGASIVYTRKIFGKLVAWLVAINVLLELVIAAAAVATGFSAYLAALIKSLDAVGPNRLADWGGKLALQTASGLSIDYVACAAVLVITLLLAVGVKQAEWFENVCTSLCILTILMCIVVGAVYSAPANWTPFAPYGFNGMFRGASIVFFAYLGFEMMANSAEDAVNPTRDLPIAIVVSVAGCTLLYLLMALVITGMQPYTEIDVDAAFASAFRARGVAWMAIVVSFGSLLGILDTIVVTQFSMSRVFVVLGRMGLVPHVLSNVHPRTQTPIISTVFCGVVSAVLALLVPLSDLADLTSLGALCAFCVVCAGVLFRRYFQPASAVSKGGPGMTGRQGASLNFVLACLLSIVGSSLGLGFGVQTGTHWALWAVMGAWWAVSTAVCWVFLPLVFRPPGPATPLFPLWPSAGILTTIFLIASLGPANWLRWAYSCLIGGALYGLFAVCEVAYNRRHGAPPPSAFEDDLPDAPVLPRSFKVAPAPEAPGGDVEAGRGQAEAAAVAAKLQGHGAVEL